MKKLSSYILLFIGFVCFSQTGLQNANWYFGNHAGLNFENNVVTEVTDMPSNGFNAYGINGRASISNKNGELLFYTNGKTVYSNNHQIMENGELLPAVGYQTVVIIPKPQNENSFYVVTRDGNTVNDFNVNYGLRYAEIDMSYNSGLGKVINKNISLKDHLGVLIDEVYDHVIDNYRREKITSTFHSDGVNYWLITQIKNYIYSYKVTGNGISMQPDKVYQVPLENPNYFTMLKISPNGNRIVTSFNNISQGVGFLAGSFNTSTGEITNMTTTIPVDFVATSTVYGVEFSPNSNYLYYITTTPSSGFVNFERINQYDFSTGQRAIIYSYPGKTLRFLQLARNGIIYAPSVGTSKFSEIVNPDDGNNVTFNFQSLTMSRNTASTLPQLIHWHNTCDSNLILNSPEIFTHYTYRLQNTIITNSNYVVNSGSTITLRAGDAIFLEPNTDIKNGSIFLAEILPCSAIVPFAQQNVKESTEYVSLVEDGNRFQLYPNPSNATTTVIMKKEIINHLTISSLEGIILFDREIQKDSYQLNVEDFKKGIYIVTIQTNDGQIYTEKLMKN